MYKFVACQTFAGGFDVGMVEAGFELVHKVEQKGGFGMPNCLANRGVLGENWSYQIGDPKTWIKKDAEVIAMNPPCSGFSVMTDQKHRGMDAKVNQCMWACSDYTALIKPQIAIMESVRPAFSRGRELMQDLRRNLEEKSGLKYGLYHVMHDALELGGSAVRKRYFWVVSQVPFGVDYPANVRIPLLPDIIGDIENLPQTWLPQPYRQPASWWSERPRKRTSSVDGHTTRTGVAHRRTLDLLHLGLEHGEVWPQSWHVGKFAKHLYGKIGFLPPSWDYMHDKLLRKDFHMGFISVTRWDNSRSARVITGGALDLVLHPTQPRFISHREVARIMGFPDDWNIYPLRHNATLKMTWGKGITTQCGKWIGEQARNALDGDPGSITGELIGDREWLIKNEIRRPVGVRSARKPVTV